MDNKLLFSGLNCLDCKGFKQLLDTQSLVDCTLACDGGRISAHKLVLSACSSYLAKILLEHPVEHPIIILPELNIEDVKTLVHYMYTGELLKSDTVNSISLLRTAAILSINSLNDLMLSTSDSSSPNSLISSHQQFANTNNSNNNNHTIRPPAAQQLQQERISIVDQISPLLAAISQQQQQQKLQHQSFGNAVNTNVSLGGYPLSQNENISRNLSTSSHDSVSTTNSSNFSSIFGAAAAAVASVNGGAGNGSAGSNDQPTGGSGNSAVAQFYNSLASGRVSSSPTSAPINSSSSSSTSPSPMNNNHKSNFNVPEPYSYTSAITGMVPAANASNNSAGSLSSSNTNEFQFKCPVCQNHFQTICSFEYHMQRAHSVTSFGCEICHKPFASLRYVLTDHMRRCHGWKSATTNSGQNNNNKNNEPEQQQQQKLQC